MPPRRRVFEPDRRLYAANLLKSLGHEFEKSQEVPWRVLDWPQSRMQEWFNARLVSHFPGGDMSPEARAYYDGRDVPGPVAIATQPSRKERRATR